MLKSTPEDPRDRIVSLAYVQKIPQIAESFMIKESCAFFENAETQRLHHFSRTLSGVTCYLRNLWSWPQLRGSTHGRNCRTTARTLSDCAVLWMLGWAAGSTPGSRTRVERCCACGDLIRRQLGGLRLRLEKNEPYATLTWNEQIASKCKLHLNV